MKTHCYIYQKHNERGMKSFEKRVSNILKTYGVTGYSIAQRAWIERASGRGAYFKCCEIEINNTLYTLKSFTNDSQFWDNFQGTSKEKRQLFEAVLNERIEKLIEIINN